jgi:hypothetical protein
MGPSASELTIPVKETEDWLVAGSCSNKQATTPAIAKYALFFTIPSIFHLPAFGRRPPGRRAFGIPVYTSRFQQKEPEQNFIFGSF